MISINCDADPREVMYAVLEKLSCMGDDVRLKTAPALARQMGVCIDSIDLLLDNGCSGPLTKEKLLSMRGIFVSVFFGVVSAKDGPFREGLERVIAGGKE